jgi:hypothetical protein
MLESDLWEIQKKSPTPSISNKHRKLIDRARYIKERTGSRQSEVETAHSVVYCTVNFQSLVAQALELKASFLKDMRICLHCLLFVHGNVHLIFTPYLNYYYYRIESINRHKLNLGGAIPVLSFEFI